MINYDSFSRHLTDIFFAFHAGAKELITVKPAPCIDKFTQFREPNISAR